MTCCVLTESNMNVSMYTNSSMEICTRWRYMCENVLAVM